MKGILHKKINGSWVVIQVSEETPQCDTITEHGLEYPLNPTYEKYYFLDYDAEGGEVEFELEKYYNSEQDKYLDYARLIRRKNDYTLVAGRELSISDEVQEPNSFIFSLDREKPIIVIDEVGFKYKGELIEDAGEIYNLFKEYLKTAK